MKFYSVEPEVAGGWGEHTVFERQPGKPTVVHKLHYQFEGWLGDELLTSTPCYVITERLWHEIDRARLTGAIVDEVEVSTSDQFKELHPHDVLPKFLWLRVNGTPGSDDFGLARGVRLVVSERALEVLNRHQVSHAVFTPYGGPLPPR